ncbi:MAG: carbohydrate kinase family protein [Clostridia bacterium]
MFDLVTLGELLVDFTESGISENNQRLFEQNPGGAVANVACAASRLGIKTAFIGKVGNDMHGAFLASTLQSVGVNTDNLIISDEVFTTLAFVALSKSGERAFVFARKPGADTCLKVEEINEKLLSECRILHVGSLSMTDEPAREATLHAVKTAKNKGAVISYDPNYRPMLWKSKSDAMLHMRSILQYADLVKISDEETVMLTDFEDPQQALQYLLSKGAKIAVVTLGDRGAMLGFNGEYVKVSTFNSFEVVDTTGAGDAFWGAFLSRILKGVPINALNIDTLTEYLRFSNAAAALCITKRGAIPAMPTEEEVWSLIKKKQ